MSKPVTILTGFLGAGKTTLLNAILSHFASTRFAIIENELGEESIDNELIVKADGDFFEMNNGCLCCSLNDNLYDLLNDLHQRRDSYDQLLIETTGIADPAGVAAPFLTEPSVANAFVLQRVVCLIDAELIEDRLQETTEAIKQLSFSDVVLINKTDAVAPEYVEKLKTTLQKLNPFAQILVGSKNSYPLEAIFGCHRTEAFDQPSEHKHGHHTHKHAHDHKHEHHHHDHAHGPNCSHEHHHHGDIVALTFRFAEPFDMQQFHHRLNVFLMFQAKDIYRVKGIIYSHEHDEKIIVQSVGRGLAVEKGKKWEADEARVSRIVIIGKLLKPAGFEKMLRTCLYQQTLV